LFKKVPPIKIVYISLCQKYTPTDCFFGDFAHNSGNWYVKTYRTVLYRMLRWYVYQNTEVEIPLKSAIRSYLLSNYVLKCLTILEVFSKYFHKRLCVIKFNWKTRLFIVNTLIVFISKYWNNLYIFTRLFPIGIMSYVFFLILLKHQSNHIIPCKKPQP